MRGLSIAVKNGVARLRLTDARRRNPLHESLLFSMRDFLTSLHATPSSHYEDAEVRCVVIESEGPVFSAGHDLADFRDAAPSTSRRILETCAEVSCLLQSIPQVTVAAVGGAAFAGGAQLAASCDIVLAHSDRASFQLTGVHGRGFCHTPLVSYGGRLAPRKAFELAVLGEQIGAEEAVSIGLANRAVADSEWEATVDGMAARLAENYNKNVADGKRTFWKTQAVPTLAEKYSIATDTMVDMMGSANWQAHIERFLDRRK